jgi:DNA-directed RNA polymerase subunit M/transcription elongation factor TFIIS
MIRVERTTAEQAFFTRLVKPTTDIGESETFMASLVLVGSVHCPGCHGTEVTYRLVQTRSADEGMTTFYVCHNCDRNWRQ